MEIADPRFWRDRRVLLTGHTGFKGGWLSLWLESMGAYVTGYSLPPPTDPSFCDVVGVEKNISATRNDIRDLKALKNCLEKAKAEIVFHLAAQALVRPSYADPVDTYSTNIMGTVNLLEAVRALPGVKAVVVVTSDKCYENRERASGYREDEAMGGYDPYSSSKGCAELVTAAYRNSFFNPGDYQRHHVAVASGRAGNVIGGGDWAKDRLIPDVLRAMIERRPVKIRNPAAVRPWQHVLEPLGGYLVLAKRLHEEGPKFDGGWNFGPSDNDTKTVKELVEEATRQWGDGARWEKDGDDQPHEAQYLKLDCSKARTLLDWQPRLDVGTALAWTVEWYKSWRAGADMRELSLRQIAAYSRMSPQ